LIEILGPVVFTGPFFVHAPPMQNDPIATAQAMLAAGRQTEAVATIATAARRGDPAAYFQQALWRITGVPLPRDLARR
jgi:hypothetical protein